MKRTVGLLVCAAVAAALLAGCGVGSDRAQRMTLAALGTPPASVSPSPPSGPDSNCANRTASLRPPAVMPAPGAMPSGSYMAQIKRHGHLIAGVDQNTLLFAYFNPQRGHIEGFEIDMLHELARAIFGDPNRIVFKAITTTERIPAVQNGTVDVVADAMTITCKRREQVDFSTVYFDAGQRILVPSNSPINALTDLRGKRVCATAGSTSIANVKRLVPTAILYPVAQRTDCLVAMQQGLVDAVSTDDAILFGLNAQDPYTNIVGPRFSDEPYGMAVSKTHPEFVQFINGVLAQMRRDGTWGRIYKRWLGRFPTPAPPSARYAGP